MQASWATAGGSDAEEETGFPAKAKDTGNKKKQHARQREWLRPHTASKVRSRNWQSPACRAHVGHTLFCTGLALRQQCPRVLPCLIR
eukprot:7382944-Prymnesium_polylepis.1